jgi:alkylation response protein AidB-like acyl-CoA dehydrogenase
METQRTAAPAAKLSWVDTTAREESLLAAARAMVPTLRARAAEAERLRRIPDETNRAFRQAGFYRVLQPARYGGFEARYGLHTDLAAEIGRGCASSAWALSVTACHSWIFGMFPREAQEDLWGADPEAAIASSFLGIKSEVEAAADGYRLRGRWRFSSNVDHCQGLIVIAARPQPDGPPAQTFFYLDRAQYVIEDTWHVVGLAATGSNDVVVADAFVPEHRMLDVMQTREARTPGGQFNTGDLYNMPVFTAFPHSLVGAALGAAQGALDTILEELLDKRSVAQVKLAELQSVQMRIAEATAEIEAARAVLKVDCAKIVAASHRRELPDDTQRMTYRLNIGYAAKLCVQAVERLLPIVGGRGLELHNPVQRSWRDVHAVAQHIALVWDVQALNYGAVRLGLKAADPRI